jgi:hypothetical protein
VTTSTWIAEKVALITTQASAGNRHRSYTSTRNGISEQQVSEQECKQASKKQARNASENKVSDQ